MNNVKNRIVIWLMVLQQLIVMDLIKIDLFVAPFQHLYETKVQFITCRA